jgi:hypothetical protein
LYSSATPHPGGQAEPGRDRVLDVSASCDSDLVEDDRTTDGTGLEQVLLKMRSFDPGSHYYALTLGANRRGQPFWSRHTHWVGFSERNPNWEIRVASLVNPGRMTRMWTALGRDWVSVHDDVSLSIFLRLGGNALAEQAITEARLPEAIAPGECVRDGAVEVGGFGFVTTGHLPDSAIQRRAPDRKLRMKVLKRGPRPRRWCMKWPPRDLWEFKQELPLLSIQPH